MTSASKVCIISHEPSGDLLGYELAEELSRLGFEPMLHQSGHAPTTYGQSGIKPLPPTMGLWDVLGKIRAAQTLLQKLLTMVKAHQPSVVVTIDSMAINGPLARRLRRELPDCPLVHYAAPKLWAWRPGRAKKLRGLFDRLLCLFPFEQKFFDQYDIATNFVGHPVVGRFSPTTNKDGSLLLLPGSRRTEIRRLLPIFLKAADMHDPNARKVVVTLPAHREMVAQHATNSKNLEIVTDDASKKRAYEQASLALAASGTVTLELAMANTPMVVAYRVDAVSAMIARRLVLVRFASLVNLILDKQVVPELLQDDCDAESLSRELRNITQGAGALQIKEFDQLRSSLLAQDNPAALAADQVAALIANQR